MKITRAQKTGYAYVVLKKKKPGHRHHGPKEIRFHLTDVNKALLECQFNNGSATKDSYLTKPNVIDNEER